MMVEIAVGGFLGAGEGLESLEGKEGVWGEVETAFDLDLEGSMKCKWVRGRKRRAFLVGVEAWGDGKWLGLKVDRRR